MTLFFFSSSPVINLHFWFKNKAQYNSRTDKHREIIGGHRILLGSLVVAQVGSPYTPFPVPCPTFLSCIHQEVVSSGTHALLFCVGSIAAHGLCSPVLTHTVRWHVCAFTVMVMKWDGNVALDAVLPLIIHLLPTTFAHQ